MSTELMPFNCQQTFLTRHLLGHLDRWPKTHRTAHVTHVATPDRSFRCSPAQLQAAINASQAHVTDKEAKTWIVKLLGMLANAQMYWVTQECDVTSKTVCKQHVTKCAMPGEPHVERS